MYKTDKTASLVGHTLSQHPTFRDKDMPLEAVFFLLGGFPSQTYYLSYAGGWGRRIARSSSTWTRDEFKASLGNLFRPRLKMKSTKKKKNRKIDKCIYSSEGGCLPRVCTACAEFRVQSPVLQHKGMNPCMFLLCLFSLLCFRWVFF